MGQREGIIGRRRVVLSAVAAISVAACGGGDDGEPLNLPIPPPLETVAPETTVEAPIEPVATDGADEPGESGSEPVDATATTDAVAEGDDPVDGEAASGDDGACLIGSWRITADELNDYYDVLAANTDTGAGSIDIGVIGDVGLELDGENYTYTADFDLTIAVAEIEGTGVSTGTVNGTYTTQTGVITTTLSSSDLAVSIDIGGVVLDGADLANGLLTDLPINDAPFGCDGPTLSFQAGPDAAIRHDVTLTPA